MLNSAPLILSEVGRVCDPEGANSGLPLASPEMIRIASPMILPKLYHNCAIIAIGFSKKYQISGRWDRGVDFLRATRDFALALRRPSAMAFSDFAHSFGPCM